MRFSLIKIFLFTICLLNVNSGFGQGECKIYKTILDSVPIKLREINVKCYIIDSTFKANEGNFYFFFESMMRENKIDSTFFGKLKTNNLIYFKNCFFNQDNKNEFISLKDIDAFWDESYVRSMTQDTINISQYPPYERLSNGNLSNDTPLLYALVTFHEVLYYENKIALTYVKYNLFSKGVFSTIWGFVFENTGINNEDNWELIDIAGSRYQ
ncbi:MAG: hypothetical protein PHT69_05270 [Bacteroidales bacterium]|nr:hypothetical protein [Bacteroidales bacterium]